MNLKGTDLRQSIYLVKQALNWAEAPAIIAFYTWGIHKQILINKFQRRLTLPLPEDTIRLFFDLINEKRIPEAINLMTDQMVGDDTSKQTWGVQFNAIQSIRVQNIESYGEEQ